MRTETPWLRHLPVKCFNKCILAYGSAVTEEADEQEVAARVSCTVETQLSYLIFLETYLTVSLIFQIFFFFVTSYCFFFQNRQARAKYCPAPTTSPTS